MEWKKNLSGVDVAEAPLVVWCDGHGRVEVMVSTTIQFGMWRISLYPHRKWEVTLNAAGKPCPRSSGEIICWWVELMGGEKISLRG